MMKPNAQWEMIFTDLESYRKFHESDSRMAVRVFSDSAKNVARRHFEKRFDDNKNAMELGLTGVQPVLIVSFYPPPKKPGVSRWVKTDQGMLRLDEIECHECQRPPSPEEIRVRSIQIRKANDARGDLRPSFARNDYSGFEIPVRVPW